MPPPVNCISFLGDNIPHNEKHSIFRRIDLLRQRVWFHLLKLFFIPQALYHKLPDITRADRNYFLWL